MPNLNTLLVLLLYAGALLVGHLLIPYWGILLALLAIVHLPNGITRKPIKWAELPTVNEYLSQHGTNQGPACSNCSSRNIWEYGWLNRHDPRRYHRCRACNSILYRTGTP